MKQRWRAADFGGVLSVALVLILPLAGSAWGMGIAQTSLKSSDLDPAAFIAWAGGAVEQLDAGPIGTGPQQVLWTADGQPDSRGVSFGKSSMPGVRHLRIGLKSPLAIGSVLVRGGGQLSVLRQGIAYPGDPGREADWQAAERIKGATVSRDEVQRDEFAIWVLPPGTVTRALRFTHTPVASDPQYEGWIGGAMVLAERVANAAPQAIADASSSQELVARVNNEKDEQWKAWDNGAEGSSQPIWPQHPEWLMLTWPRPITLSGLETIWTGFEATDVQMFAGPADEHPREAPDSDWKTIEHFVGLQNGYPLPLYPQAMPFPSPVTTRAVRLRITSVTGESHPHLKGKTSDGRRVWLGELLALHPLGDAPLATALLPSMADESHPPIPVRFKLAEPGFVTLVIDDSAGKRVRNLIAETSFPAGANVAWWDGADDSGRDLDAARHGLYHIPEEAAPPGTYRVRGLFHKGLKLRYEFSIYEPGNPPWETADTSGGWLTNHTPPQAALFVPASTSPNGQPMVYLGSAVSEGGAGLAWVDLDGEKVGGRGWIGGNWTAAPYLAKDQGGHALPDIYAYVGAAWTSGRNDDRTHGELRITGLTAKGDKAILKYPFTPPAPSDDASRHDADWINQLGGIAVHDGLLVASLQKLNQLLFVDVRSGKVIANSDLPNPRGLAFDADGRLLVLSGTKLLRYKLNADAPGKLAAPNEVFPSGLEDPHGITLDAAGNIYICDHGDSHQVKVLSPDGKLLRVIGHPGPPRVGVYDPLHMNHPLGLAIDDRQQLWVTEDDFQPKRVSVWTLEGKLLRSFYGPARYGGGGTLDPRDKTRFYYDGIEFKLDWKNGVNAPSAVFYREGADDLSSPFRGGPPETPIYLGDRQYMTNCFNSSPTNGAPLATIWLMKDRVAMPVASLGRATDWGLLKREEFRAKWPKGMDPNGEPSKNACLFVWTDLNADGRVQPNEVTLMPATTGGVTVAGDLSFVVSRVDDKAMRFTPREFTARGAPIYDLNHGQVLARGVQTPASSGGDQALISPDGWSILTVAPKPWAREGFGGVKDGQALWSYPSLWPGLHASHEAAVPDRPGEAIGSTRLLGGFITPAKGDAGPLWCVNGNMGDMYLLTADGLLVAQLFQDARIGKPWIMPRAERGMLLNDLTLHDENFFPTITQTRDGQVYLCDGGRSSLVRIDGLEEIRRLPTSELQLTADDLKNAAAWRTDAETRRQSARGTSLLRVPIRKAALPGDTPANDWTGADWAVIDRRGTAANFNSDSKPYDVTAAVAVAGDRLHVVFRTRDAELLENSGETANAPFKTGGCLDLMIGADPTADPKRSRPVAGDQRLLITQVRHQTVALLYRAVVPGTAEPVPFSSPWRTITLDRVDDISAQVKLSADVQKDERGKVKSAIYALSVPLDVLNLHPADGQTIKADIGILRGNGFQTLQRVYWNNKASAITSDVPSEAELTPALWGKWVFKIEK
jgi:hypothetical protein